MLHVLRTRFPDFAPGIWTELSLRAATGDVKGAESEAREAVTRAGEGFDDRAEEMALDASLAFVQGHIADEERETRDLLDLVQRKGRHQTISSSPRSSPSSTRGIATRQSACAPGSIPPSRATHSRSCRPRSAMRTGSRTITRSRETLRARVTLDQYESAHPVYGAGDLGTTERSRGAIALAEHRYAEAQTMLRKSQADYWYPTCSYPDLGRAYKSGGQMDSGDRFVHTIRGHAVGLVATLGRRVSRLCVPAHG